MSHIINNIDLDKIRKTTESGQKDRQFLRKPVKLEGEWNFDVQKVPTCFSVWLFTV